MHRLVWFAAVAAIAAAAGLYVGAGVATRHPESAVSRGLAALCRMDSRSETRSDDAAPNARSCCTDADQTGTLVLNGQTPRRDASQPPCFLVPNTRRPAQTLPMEFQDRRMLEFAQSYPTVVKLDSVVPSSAGEEIRPTFSDQVLSALDPAGEEAYDGCPRVMPPSAEEEIPLSMPYSIDPSRRQRPPRAADPWMHLFRDLKADDAPPAGASACQEDGSTEEPEPLHERVVPSCQEDPTRPFQYPGCPFTGPTPLGPGQMPSTDRSSRPGVGKGQELGGPIRTRGRKPIWPGSGAIDIEDRPAQPGIDTMEFRPGDARTSEYTKKRPL